MTIKVIKEIDNCYQCPHKEVTPEGSLCGHIMRLVNYQSIPQSGIHDDCPINDFVQPMVIEGNNGGDYINIQPVGDNLVRLEVGHCCVVSFSGIIPVEILTTMISDSAHTKFTKELALWPKAFGDELMRQIDERK